MRRWATLGLLVLLGTTVVWAADLVPATQYLQDAFPDVQFYAQGPQITRVWGAIFGLGQTPEHTADAFIREHSAVFDVAPQELQPGSAVSGEYTLPLMYQPETGTRPKTASRSIRPICGCWSATSRITHSCGPARA